ncbi:MAG: XdhC family protein [Hyphomicrobiales bacterium]|nr:XdhC family protein [Hyphomicrobiales bacterium]
MPDLSLKSHPLDVLEFVREHCSTGVAIVFVTDVSGGSVRSPGIRMAVSSDGSTIGYVSNGCIEADVIMHCLRAIKERRPAAISYGLGSENFDLRLPCGGQIHLLLVPVSSNIPLDATIATLAGRRNLTLALYADGRFSSGSDISSVDPADWTFRIIPKIRLFISGIGSETMILAEIARTTDMEVIVQSPDGATLDLARASGFPVRQFLGLSNTPLFEADALTAHALMFHDHEWEVKLLTEALRSEAFYVGALGSIRAQENRFQALLAAGLCKENVERLKAPIGLVPRLRDPHLLAISVVAEIAAEFQKQFGSF